jgi:transposase
MTNGLTFGGRAVRAYSMDLRERVLADLDEGRPPKDLAAKYRVSVAWVRRLRQRRRETGETGPRACRHGPRPSWEGYAERLREAVRQTPDATLAELKARLALTAALSTLWRAVAALGLTVKKKSRGRPSKTGRT